jgi:hypothetical protein
MDSPELSRRSFLALTSAGAVGMFAGRAHGRGEVEPERFPVPADKRFPRGWLASLTARGEPLRARSARDELRFVGMPVGGVGCGQVLLSGDGRLWCWDVFNRPPSADAAAGSGAEHASPPLVSSPFRVGFSLVESDQSRPLDAGGFRDITFTGHYPVGTVDFSDEATRVRVELQAFSPFCPLELEDSSLPCTILRYRMRNAGDATIEAAIHGALQNHVGVATPPGALVRSNRAAAAEDDGPAMLVCEANPPRTDARPDLVIDDFEAERFAGWTATDTAFGDGPRRVDTPRSAQRNANGSGSRVASSRSAIPDDPRPDLPVGTLSSGQFTIARRFIRFRIGGGRNPGQTCINLLVDGAVVRTATGDDTGLWRLERWDVAEFEGRTARLQIVDVWRSDGGSIAVDDIVMADEPRGPAADPTLAPDWGTMAFALLTPRSDAVVVPDAVAGDRPVGELRVPFSLAPGGELTLDFVIAWHFPNVDAPGDDPATPRARRRYAARFADATAVVRHVHARREPLIDRTLRWRDAWNDSTLPFWFLERTFANIATLATSTCLRLDDGGCRLLESASGRDAPCDDAWQHAQAAARVFPTLERSRRLAVDFGPDFDVRTGLVPCRGEATPGAIFEAHCASLIRAWREHRMSPDRDFLRAVFPNAKRAGELLLSLDENADGLADEFAAADGDDVGGWTPRMASLSLAALRAAASLASEAGDSALAAACITRANAGADVVVDRCFRGGWFRSAIDRSRSRPTPTGEACAVDQVVGQALAWQAGLPRVLPRAQTVEALRSIFRHNVATDVGPYRAMMEKTVRGGRWLALPGEGGTIMCTWPQGGAAQDPLARERPPAGAVNECQSGHEHLLASHMLAEGLVTEGLAVTRLVHDRHHPSVRNPYSEVECGGHAARAMASHGTFVAACGFRHHGPRGELSFEPRVFDVADRRRFRAAFIAGEGWGSYSQELLDGVATHSIKVLHGKVRLRAFGVPMLVPLFLEDLDVATLAGPPVQLVRREVDATGEAEQAAGFGRYVLEFAPGACELGEGDQLVVRLSRRG